jgi:hypothetical protein
VRGPVHVTVVLAATLLAAPATADARFVINRSMAGVRLGMDGAQVRAQLGPPTLVTRHGRTRNLVYRERKLFVTLVGGRVHILSTDGGGQRGPRGIGVGTREARLRRVVRTAICESAEGVRTCAVDGFDFAQTSTVFVIERRRVSTVTITRGF